MKIASFIAVLIFSFSSMYAAPLMWNTPVAISTSGVDATDSHIAMDTNGNLVSVWVENNAVVASTQPFNGSWITPVTISTAAASSPKVMVDSNGNATAVWINGGKAATATLPFGGSWGTVNILSVSGASDPQLAISSSGDVVAVWAINGTIQSATKAFGGSWPLLPDTLSVTGVTSDTPRVAIGGPSKTVVAVWHGFNTIDTVYAVTKNIGGLWGLVNVISPATISSSNPRIAVGPGGGALATFFEYAITGLNAYSAVSMSAAFLPPGGIWRVPGTIKDTGIANPASLNSKVIVDANGNGLAVWTTSYDGENYSLQSAVLQLNGLLTPAAEIAVSPYIYGLSVAINAAGNAVLTYMAGVTGTSNLVINNVEMSVDSFSPNVWNNQLVISTNPVAGYPSLASAYFGGAINVAASWKSSDGMNTIIQAVTGSGGVLIPPSNLMVAQSSNNFSIVTEYYNTLNWSASTDPELAGYVIYRNGILVTTVPPGTLEFVDHNRVPGVPDTYGVAAYGDQFQQSVTITATYP